MKKNCRLARWNCIFMSRGFYQKSGLATNRQLERKGGLGMGKLAATSLSKANNGIM